MFSSNQRPTLPGYYYDEERDMYLKIPSATDPLSAFIPPNSKPLKKEKHEDKVSPSNPPEVTVKRRIADFSLHELWMQIQGIGGQIKSLSSDHMQSWHVARLKPKYCSRLVSFYNSNNVWDCVEQCFYRGPTFPVDIPSRPVYFEPKLLECRESLTRGASAMSHGESDVVESPTPSESETDFLQPQWDESVLLYDLGGHPIQYGCLIERSPSRLYAWSREQKLSRENDRESSSKSYQTGKQRSTIFINDVETQARYRLRSKQQPRSVNPNSTASGQQSVLTVACTGGAWNRCGEEGVVFDCRVLHNSGQHNLIPLPKSEESYSAFFTHHNQLLLSKDNGQLCYYYLDELCSIQNEIPLNLPNNILSNYSKKGSSKRLQRCESVLVHPSRSQYILMQHGSGSASVWDSRNWKQPVFIFPYRSSGRSNFMWSCSSSEDFMGEYFLTAEWVGNMNGVNQYNVNQLCPMARPMIYHALTGQKEVILEYPNVKQFQTQIGDSLIFSSIPSHAVDNYAHGHPGVGLIVPQDSSYSVLHLLLNGPFNLAFTYHVQLDNKSNQINE